MLFGSPLFTKVAETIFDHVVMVEYEHEFYACRVKIKQVEVRVIVNQRSYQ